MANRDNPHGLAPLMRTLSGGAPSIRQYARDADGSTAIFVNDVVSRDADGNINAGGTPNTTTFQGVSLVYAAGSVAKTDILVMDSPGALYEAQDNHDTDGLAEADMGLMCDLEFNAGSTTTFISGHEIDESAAADTTTDLDVKLLSKLDAPDNAYGAHCRVVIMFNQHRLNPGVAGV
jgi:hypothetical protein